MQWIPFALYIVSQSYKNTELILKLSWLSVFCFIRQGSTCNSWCNLPLENLPSPELMSCECHPRGMILWLITIRLSLICRMQCITLLTEWVILITFIWASHPFWEDIFFSVPMLLKTKLTFGEINNLCNDVSFSTWTWI